MTVNEVAQRRHQQVAGRRHQGYAEHAPAPFAATVTTEGVTAVVTLRGEADVFTLPAVRTAFARAVSEHSGPVTVDLADTSFIDIGTLRALAQAAELLNHRGRALTVKTPSPMARRLFAFVGLSQLIERNGITVT